MIAHARVSTKDQPNPLPTSTARPEPVEGRPSEDDRRPCFWSAVALLLAMMSAGCGSSGAVPGVTPEPQGPLRAKVVFFGDSLTAGHGLDRSEAYPALLQAKLDAARLPFEAVNAGVSGDTTADGTRRLDWVLSRGADLMVVELGANDGLRGGSLEAARKNLAEILTRLRARAIPIVLVGMRIPPNYGPDYSEKFHSMYPSLAKEFGVPLVEFLLDGVGGHADRTLPDGIHPNAAGQRVMADTVWKTLEPVLHSLAAQKLAGKP